MAIPTIGEAKAKLRPYHTDILTVIDGAFAEWRRVQELRAGHGYPPLLYSRTKANDIFDGIARRAIPLFGVNPKVRVEIEAQTFKLLIADLVVRIKKAGDDMLGSNVPTLAATLFEDADAQLPGFPAQTGKIEVVWTPNEIWTQIESVRVVARDGDRMIWEYEIEREGGADIVPLPKPDEPPADGRGLIKPKKTPSKKPDEK